LGVSPENLTLEVTEGVFVNEASKAVQCLHELKALGICISIDDFGTGYSCLSYFKNIPAGELKIDKSFIDHLTEDGDDRYLAQLMIDLGHRFNLFVVADGIEDQETFTMLQDMGCDYAQGFFRGKPMPHQDVLVGWLDKHKKEEV
jgi:EAL domain-containing protein (putative c-di-GMP-specific phosphodiesterase class I)